MLKKPKYCIGAVLQEGKLKCPVCDKEFYMAGLKPVLKEKIDKEIKRFKTQGRVQECFFCDHKVIICESCVHFKDTVICDCCLEEFEEAENL